MRQRSKCLIDIHPVLQRQGSYIQTAQRIRTDNMSVVDTAAKIHMNFKHRALRSVPVISCFLCRDILTVGDFSLHMKYRHRADHNVEFSLAVSVGYLSVCLLEQEERKAVIENIMVEEEDVIENVMGIKKEDKEVAVTENFWKMEEKSSMKKEEQIKHKRGIKRPLEEEQGGRKAPLQPTHSEDCANVTLAGDDGLKNGLFSGLSDFFFGKAQETKTNPIYKEYESKHDPKPKKGVQLDEDQNTMQKEHNALNIIQYSKVSERPFMTKTPNTKAEFKPKVTSTQLKKNILISCNECNETFTKPNLWALHMKKHTYPYQCQFCQRQFKNENESRRHQQLMHTSLK